MSGASGWVVGLIGLALCLGRAAGVDADGGLQRFLIDTLHKPGNSGAAIVLSLIGHDGVKLMDADALGLTIRHGAGGALALPWSMISEQDLIATCRPYVAKAPSRIQALYLAAQIRQGHGGEPDCQDLLAQLRVSDSAAAELIDSQPAPSSPGHLPIAHASGDGATEHATADGTAQRAVEAAPVEPPAAPAIPVADAAEEPSPLFDKHGKINKAAYVRAALDGSPAALDRRMGPDAASLMKSDHSKAQPQGEPKDSIWSPPLSLFKPARNGQGMNWEIGGPANTDPGDYSSTHAQVLYIPDKANDPGVDRISILEMGHNVFTYRPEPTWWGGSHPEPSLATPAWVQACGGALGSPVAIARAYGNWSNSALIVFTSGLVGTAGTCTSQNSCPFLVLPKGKIPTAISITNKNEFALITVWDVEQFKGQVAVIALESMHTDGLMALYEWHVHNPCLPNVGGFTSMKLLGFIDLPFATPTAISAAGNRTSEWIHIAGKNSNAKDVDFAQQAMRDSFLKGENANYMDSAGCAVVVSRHEHKASFIDLQPLFEHVREMYCTTEENYQKTRTYGPDPKQWPCSFDIAPRTRPMLVKTLAVRNPTAVNVSITGGAAARAYIATLDGKLYIYQVGGLGKEGPCDPGAIGPTGLVQIGRNPVCLAYSKSQGWAGPDTMRSDIIAVCRGDRELDWVHFHGDAGEVVSRLRDARLLDPVWMEVADGHGTESHVFTVVDFKGRKVVDYRNGPVIFHTNGGKRYDMGADGKADFECGGVMDFPGYPFALCGTNVN
jgi:hypothetical protein